MSLVLLDTQLLYWTGLEVARLPEPARVAIERADAVIFSVVSIWEVAIKSALRRPDFRGDAAELRDTATQAGYRELSVFGEHAIAVRDLPPLHRDPFDRLLLAQAAVERATFLTTDRTLARYPGDIRVVR